MARRNRWFTVLKNGGSFHGELLVITRGYMTIATDHLLSFWLVVSTLPL